MSAFIHRVQITLGGSQDHWLAYADKLGRDPLELKLEHGRTFLDALYGPYSPGDGLYVELRCFPPKAAVGAQKGLKPFQSFFGLDEENWKDALLDAAFEQEYLRNDVYVGVLPRNRKRGQATDVDRAAVVFADLDAKSIPWAEIDRRTKDCDLRVHSGGGVHAYDFLPRVMETDERYKILVRAYQKSLGSDAIHDLPRVLRLCGTSNMKNPDDPKCVRILKRQKSEPSI